MTIPEPRLPIEALYKITNTTEPSELNARMDWGTGRLAGMLKDGGLTATTADRVAVALGYLPVMVWGDDWLNLPDGACGPLEILTPEDRKERRRENEAKRVKRIRGKVA